MEEILLEILAELRTGHDVDDKRIAQVLDRHNKEAGEPARAYAKKHVIPYYLRVKAEHPETWRGWNVDDALESRLLATLRIKPRRTASGVATITVITKPWPCANSCLYCPNDIRMPKSYLHDEPACQRAERNFFDPYLQAASRLQALENMGHVTDKIELIVLGGTWADYPSAYQIWFVQQLFQALNDDGATRAANATARRRRYEAAGSSGATSTHGGISGDPDVLAAHAAPWQQAIDAGDASYNQAFCALYGSSPAWQDAASWQEADLGSLFAQHRINETARHRVVGLVVETRPDTVNERTLQLIRQLGATKVQMGIQSLDPEVLRANLRLPGEAEDDVVARALDLVRLFGFKAHTHFMANLLGSSPAADIAEYARFMHERPYQPDEVKIYPCTLVAGTGLEAHYRDGSWRPYTEEELLGVLAADVLATPAFCRVSRMIRDISAKDIMAGNKKANLRQLVEQTARASGQPIAEMRYREINSGDADPTTLSLRETRYETISTHEVFLQWTTPRNRIAGFLRLSLPKPEAVAAKANLPIRPGQAMIREVHVYGRVASIEGTSTPNAQHAGLGRALIEHACAIAAEAGYDEINVISSVGTREYYRHLGFRDGRLYQTRRLPRAQG
jgi:elongator complex protein 3